MAPFSARHPFIIRPAEILSWRDDRGRRRRGFGKPRDGIGLLRQSFAMRPEDRVFVALTCADARNENLPDAGPVAKPHRMAALVPGIEVADDRDAARIRRPDREANTLDITEPHRQGAEAGGELLMASFREEVKIDVAQQGAEGVGIFGDLDATGPFDAQYIRLARNEAVEKPARARRFKPG